MVAITTIFIRTFSAGRTREYMECAQQYLVDYGIYCPTGLWYSAKVSEICISICRTQSYKLHCTNCFMFNWRGIPTRLTAAFWWFFAMIVTSSYTANMAAFLTKEHMEESFKDVEELSKESNLRYGLMKGGSTEAFFKVNINEFSIYAFTFNHFFRPIEEFKPWTLPKGTLFFILINIFWFC